ncbi:MAG: hypothetical protein JWL86_2137 [Rhizobium sp.]|nr:hypothetical protein [Rhizobium sp.]
MKGGNDISKNGIGSAQGAERQPANSATWHGAKPKTAGVCWLMQNDTVVTRRDAHLQSARTEPGGPSLLFSF